jgi:hypothetical protein
VRNFAYNGNRRAAEARASWETAKPEVTDAELDDRRVQRRDEPAARQGA